MTPKEKAKYIFNKFRNVEIQMHSPSGFYMGTTQLSFETSIICCEIFIDQMLIETKGAKYWQEVKEEINRSEFPNN
jgi:hypothetical protein